MPRAKCFDRNDALEKAMKAFWSRGYEATSMQDLVDCMGINRGSLYNTFGGKHELFLEALDHYGQNSLLKKMLTARAGGGGVKIFDLVLT